MTTPDSNMHTQDFSEALTSAMKDYDAYCSMMQYRVPMRQYMWDTFASIVAMHVAEYSVPQYGDYPTDQLTNYTADDCMKAIQRYANRWGNNARGEDESLRDLLKIAHYAQTAYYKARGYESIFTLPEPASEPESDDKSLEIKESTSDDKSSESRPE